MSCRVPSNLLGSLHMKRSKAHPSPCTHDFSAAFVQEHQRAVLDFHHGKYLSFRKGHSSLVFRATTVDPKPFRAYEIRGEPIGITGIVVVRVAVGVHIAEVVGVVVIRRPLPPIRSRTHGRKTPTDRLYRDTPTEIKTYLPLSLFKTLVNKPFSVSISSPRSCAMRPSFFFASDGGTEFPLPVVKHPDGFVIISS